MNVQFLQMTHVNGVFQCVCVFAYVAQWRLECADNKPAPNLTHARHAHTLASRGRKQRAAAAAVGPVGLLLTAVCVR